MLLMKTGNYQPWRVPGLSMTIDVKVRIGLLVASLAISAFAGVAAAHGLYVGPLDSIAPGPH